MNAPPVFLTADELAQLTGGLRQAAAQIRWLRKNGVHHYAGADGKPVVPRTAIDPPGEAEKRRGPPSTGPNFGALRSLPGRRA